MKIDYQQIKQDFPKAYDLFLNSEYFRVSEPDGYLCFDDRDLYDFFDEQELYICVDPINERKWGWSVESDRNMLVWWETLSKSRTEAECAAFNAAFKLLEETL